jgi:acetyl-CoA carboxylase biotin carboxyl carrier protein
MKKIESPVAGVLMHYLVKTGDVIVEGQEVAMVESMKMEIPVVAEVGGTVTRLCRESGATVAESDALIELS